ncbi:allatostatin-A receptor-like [Saccoglossus kowalevskii]|uniref:Allatostatin-A receptor-like n=1 Tax=Saccoglossus kowalevskii TaxID=10224 RepID=A0ABM0MGA0_SACKO|nr:PREDICTED: allatostatin-A receptor-like [Saccoglossus kowalevskii]
MEWNTSTLNESNLHLVFPPTPAYVYITELILGIIGTMGNALVIIVVISTPKMKTLTNYFIINLAVADFMTSALLVLNRFLPKVVTFVTPSGIAGQFYCRLYFSAQFFWFSINTSSFNLLLVTMERYFAIVYPLSYDKYYTTGNALAMIAMAWISMFVLQFVTVIFHDYKNGNCMLSVYPYEWVGKLIGVLYFIITYFVPICVMAWAYFRILSCLKVSANNGSTPSAADDQLQARSMLKARQRVIWMLLLVIVTFATCWTPDSLLFLAYNLGTFIDLGADYVNCIVLLKFSNSILNPFIYVFKYKQFRTSFLKKFCHCLPMLKNKVSDGSTGSATMQT